jgi:class 3 adenylate cyclase/tetratricopeptide (TPR) repeat protein
VSADPTVAATAERRRVSVLFLDLEDFTALAELLDPEEVRALQSRYFETARSLITRYGGSVEKFIGDAVMAVWGTPAAHDDDPARAVQAAISLVAAVSRLGGASAKRRLSGRAAVTTGEAVVTVGATAQGMVAGDLVNVASRLQGHAPSGGVLVDEATRTLAQGAGAFKPFGPIDLRGRRTPIAAYIATPPTTADPDRTRGLHAGAFVGRDDEVRELLDLWDGVVRHGRSRLVSITGIAGIGKSRLVWELREMLERRPDLVAWHEGRAPAYGEEITFVAVAEMLRHRIGAVDGVAPEIAQRQVATALTELVRDDEERRWMEPRLAALLDARQLGAFARDELFAAWRQFFERVSATMPAVLVFEDIHWADPSLIAFIEHLAAWARSHPILVLTLARPELLDRHPTWGSTVGRFTAVHLERLPDRAMRALLERREPHLAEPSLLRILQHAGGVPLYAVEVIRMMADGAPSEPAENAERHAAGTSTSTRGDMPLAVPDSLHGVIAARIDAIPPDERRLLLAAAVLGRRFKLQALVGVGADAGTVRDRIQALVRRELLAPVGEAGIPGRGELAFVQDVVREVAYGTLTRSERQTLHLAAARWLESEPGTDAAEALAGHLSRAHDLAPHHADAARIARRAVAALRRAAAASVKRHVPEAALGHLEQALRLTDGAEQRAVVLAEAAVAASAAARLELAEQHLRELIRIHAEAGRKRDTAQARAQLASVLLMAQRNEPAVAELESALRAVRDIGRDASGVQLAAQLARARVLLGDNRGALAWAKRAIDAAERLGLDQVRTDLLVTRGTAQFGLGKEDAGLEDLRRAIREAEAAGSIATELRARNNLAWLLVADDPRATLETARQAVELATTMGVGDLAAQLAEVACAAAVETGDWDWAVEAAGELDQGLVPEANRINLAATIGIIHVLRGEPNPLAAIDAIEPLPTDLDAQIVAGIEMARAWAAFTAGDPPAARVLAQRAASRSLGITRGHAHALAARASLWSGDRASAESEVAALESLHIAGRAADAQLLTLRAGLLSGQDHSSAQACYRRAEEAWRSLDLPAHMALTLIDEHRLLGVPSSPEMLAVLDQLGAAGLRRLVRDGAVNPPRAAPPPARSRRPKAGTARHSGAGHRPPPATGRRSPAG